MPGRTASVIAEQDRRLGKRATYDPMRPDVFSLAIDTREQLIGRVPLSIPIVVRALPVGDLSVPGFEERIAIDRKQIGDFITCLTRDKERFTRLLVRMSELDFGAVIVEAPIADVRKRKFRNNVEPSFVLAAAAHITTKYGVPVLFCGSLDVSTDYAIRLLRAWWWNRGLRRELKPAGGDA